MATSYELGADEYRALAAFRYQIRKFLRFSEEAARRADLEPQHHQLMLAIKGLPDGAHATVGELAERLQIQHHSAVELINRLADQGLVARQRSERDRRQVFIELSTRGERRLRDLALHHREQLKASAPELIDTLKSILHAGNRSRPAAAKSAARRPARQTRTTRARKSA